MWLVFIAVVLFVSVIPVKIGAHVVGARRTDFLVCLAALLVASLISGFAVRAFHFGGVLAIFVAALGYMLILDTTYLRGLVIAFLQIVLTVALVFALAATVFGGLAHSLHGLLR